MPLMDRTTAVLPLLLLGSACVPAPAASAPSANEVSEASPDLPAARPCPDIPREAVGKPKPATAIRWPSPACVARVDELLSRMTLAEKVGQMLQSDAARVRDPKDLARLGLGSVLSGGGETPGTGNTPRGWALWTRGFHQASTTSRQKIPLLYGLDAVHGHSNVKGTVIFPHNIGLGATRDPALVERVARITAIELAATGVDWTFSPVLAAAKDERWGRTYEAFGETAELAESLGVAQIRGLQGASKAPGERRVMACAKHFAGDGGTVGGRDRGDTPVDEATFLREHVAPFKAAVQANVASIMVSYSSFQGVRMHCQHHLLTEVLKRDLGFDGFLVSDWEAVDKLPGSYADKLASSVNAGLDMIMAPPNNDAFATTLASLVPTRVPKDRIDDAARRILSAKCEFGMLDSNRWPGAAEAVDDKALATVGSPEHRAVAREAVARSVVLLKNTANVLPIAKTATVLHLAGAGADDLGRQCGGWTISWQGGLGKTTTGTTLRTAITERAGSATRVTYSVDGSGAAGASLGIVVGGETPYAEYKGDRKDLSLAAEDIEALRAVKRQGIPAVLLLLTGRPLILGPALDLADAIVVAWLPGTEGQGVADVLFGDVPPTGKLGHSWPRTMNQIPINVGDKTYDPLFPYGFGLGYAAAK